MAREILSTTYGLSVEPKNWNTLVTKIAQEERWPNFKDKMRSVGAYFIDCILFKVIYDVPILGDTVALHLDVETLVNSYILGIDSSD